MVGSEYFALEWPVVARVISLVAMTPRARSVFLIIPNVSVINVTAVSRERDILRRKPERAITEMLKI